MELASRVNLDHGEHTHQELRRIAGLGNGGFGEGSTLK